MPELIIVPGKTKGGQIGFIVTDHDPRSDNSFTITTINDLSGDPDKLKVRAHERG